MIRGALFDPNASPQRRRPIWCVSPWVKADISIPKLGKRRKVTFLVDTGADVTSLSVRDAVRLIGKRGFRQLSRLKDLSGVGGKASYFEEPAQIVFRHDDGTVEGFDFILYIAKPSRKKSRTLRQQLQLPSLLGKNIIFEFRMVMDYSKKQLFLDHN
jgi:hypothetical protein